MSEMPVVDTELRCFERPFIWESIDAVMHEEGGVILKNFFSSDEVASFNRDVDEYLIADEDAGKPRSGSTAYDKFLGHKTVRLQGLIEKVPNVAEWIGHPELCDWAGRTLKPVATSTLLNAAELIQIGPGEPRQYLHRDSDSWPMAPLGEHPLIVNAVVALDPFTLANGATHVAPGSWRWDRKRKVQPAEMLRAVMEPGDVLVFRGDIVHGGGANTTDVPRRALSISYCVGWLRTVENSILNISRERIKTLPKHLQQLLGYAAYDGSRDNGGLLGLYENGDPSILLE